MRKFRIIKKLSYTHETLDEKITVYIQEWKKNWWGKWNYDLMEKRTFETVHHAEEMIKKFVNQKPSEKVVKEIGFK